MAAALFPKVTVAQTDDTELDAAVIKLMESRDAQLRPFNRFVFSGGDLQSEQNAYEDLFHTSRKYGVDFREFEEKFGKDKLPFTANDSFLDRKELAEWVQNNPDKPYTEKMEKLEQYLDKQLSRAVLEGGSNAKELKAYRQSLKGYFCGYVEDLCEPTN